MTVILKLLVWMRLDSASKGPDRPGFKVAYKKGVRKNVTLTFLSYYLKLFPSGKILVVLFKSFRFR